MANEARAEAWAGQAEKSRELAAGYLKQTVETAKAVAGIRDSVQSMLSRHGIVHEWDGTSLRIMGADGEFGDYVDLVGAIPAHVWVGTTLRFQGADGEFGEGVDLRGLTGPAVNLSVGEVITGEAGSEVGFELSGVAPDYQITVTIPRGDPGNVTGPDGATAGNLAALDATGNILSDSGKAPTDFAAADHNHDDAYAALGHNHDAAYASVDHNHDAAYAAVGHSHDLATTESAGFMSTEDKALLDASAPGWKHIATATISTPVVSVDFTDIPQTYSDLIVVLKDVSHNYTSSNLNLRISISTDNGASWSAPRDITGSFANAAAASSVFVLSGYALDYGFSFNQRPTSTPTSPEVSQSTSFYGGTTRHTGGANAVRVSVQLNEIDAGTITIYGR